MSLVGDWRIGKSSILATCYEHFAKSSRPVRLLNGESQAGASPADFVKAATGAAAAPDSDAAANVLSIWARQSKRPGLLPLLLVDECDVLVRRFDYRFFERLRGMLDDLCLGVSSRRELDYVFKDAGKGASPFQNRLELHWVGLLEPASADQLSPRPPAGCRRRRAGPSTNGRAAILSSSSSWPASSSTPANSTRTRMKRSRSFETKPPPVFESCGGH